MEPISEAPQRQLQEVVTEGERQELRLTLNQVSEWYIIDLQAKGLRFHLTIRYLTGVGEGGNHEEAGL